MGRRIIMNDKVKKIIQPYWVEEQQGVYIPLIDKVLLKDNVPAMSYAKFIEYAKTNRVEIATKEELLQMYSQKDDINKILKEHGGDILDNWFGSSSEHLSLYEWFVNFGSGNWSYSSKHYPYVSRAVVDLKSKTNNKTMEQFNLEEYLKNPNKKVVTRNGEDARIVCTDMKGTDFPIIALCGGATTGEMCRMYDANGNYSEIGTSMFDLVFAEECNKSINTVKTAFIEKASEYAEKHFPSDDISNSGKHNVARPFSVEEYIKNPERKVVTRDGRDVRIICTDRKGTEDTVLALCLMSDGSENCYCYPPNGKEYLTSDSYRDLFFATEKHEGWINLAIDSSGEIFVATNHPHKDEKTAKLAVSDKSNVVATIKIEWEE